MEEYSSLCYVCIPVFVGHDYWYVLASFVAMLVCFYDCLCWKVFLDHPNQPNYGMFITEIWLICRRLTITERSDTEFLSSGSDCSFSFS